jgi:sigma-B regulation protein RsbQ
VEPSVQTDASGVLRRNNVMQTGNPAGRPIVFAHGFGCSSVMWRDVVPQFEPDFRVVRFDLVGAGDSDTAAYDEVKYDSLHGYADDVLEILEALDLHDVVFVGHSVSSMIGLLASNSAPERFGALVLVGPSPRYVNDGEYFGGYEREDIEGLLDALDANHLGWSSMMAPVISGNEDRPELAAEWEASFCRIDPVISRHFGRVTFLSDNRRDLEQVTVPTLIVQATDDSIAPEPVGRYVHDHIPGSRFVHVPTTGHLVNLSDPHLLSAEIRSFLA